MLSRRSLLSSAALAPVAAVATVVAPAKTFAPMLTGEIGPELLVTMRSALIYGAPIGLQMALKPHAPKAEIRALLNHYEELADGAQGEKTEEGHVQA